MIMIERIGMNQSASVPEKVEVAVADGTRMAAYVARPQKVGPHPGLLLFQEAFGVNHHIRSVSARFAAEGYVVIAPELYHRTAPPGFEGSYSDFPAVMPHARAVTTETAELDVQAAHEWLRSNAQVRANEISSVGFCTRRFRFMEEASLPGYWIGRRSCKRLRCSSGVGWISTSLRSTGKR